MKDGAERVKTRNCGDRARERVQAAGLRVYFADVTALEDEALYGRALQCASEERREKALRFRFPEDRRRCLAAELLLKKALADRGYFPEELHYVFSEDGKPALKGFPDFHFNLSHSGKYVMAAAAETEVGCDIEEIRRLGKKNAEQEGSAGGTGKDGCGSGAEQVRKERSMFLQIAERMFHPEETAALAAASEEDRPALFFRFWTLRESFVKARGTGLSHPGSEYLPPEIPGYSFSEYGGLPGYAAAVCTVEVSTAASCVTGGSTAASCLAEEAVLPVWETVDLQLLLDRCGAETIH